MNRLVKLLIICLFPSVMVFAQSEDEGLLLDWHPSGEMIAYTYTRSNEIVIVDVSTNSVLNTFTTTDIQTSAPRWSADGEFLAFRDSLSSVSVWSNASEAELASNDFTFNSDQSTGYPDLTTIREFAWHPSETKIALLIGVSLNIWQPLSDMFYEVPNNEHIIEMSDLKWFDDDTLLLTEVWMSYGLLVDAQTGMIDASFLVWGGTTDTGILATIPAPDRSEIAVLSSLNNLEIWNPANGELDARYGLETVESNRFVIASNNRLFSVDWNAAGDAIATVDNNGIVRVWNAETLVLLQEYNQAVSRLSDSSVAWSPDGTQLAFGTTTFGLQLVDVTSDSELQAIPLVHEGILLDWHPSGEMIAYTYIDSNEISIIDVDSGNVLNTLTVSGYDYFTTAPQWSPDGDNLAFLDSSASIAVWSNAWDVSLASEYVYLDVAEKLGDSNILGISGFAWNPTGTQIALSMGYTFDIWDVHTDNYLNVPSNEYLSTLQDIKWFDEDTLLVGDTSPQAALVSSQTGEIESVLYLSGGMGVQAVTAIAPAPDRSRVALVSTFGRLETWDPTHGTFHEGFLLTYDSEQWTFGSDSRMVSLDWNVMGEHIAMIDENGIIRVWKAETLELIYEYNQRVTGLSDANIAWSPDSTQLAFGTSTYGLQIVDVPPID